MLNPTIFFFILGVLATVLKVGIRLPKSIYEVVSMFLLLTIGIKGGMELTQHPFAVLGPKIAIVFSLGLSIPFLAYPVLRKVGKFNNPDAASIAAHYGSVSVGTYAVGISFLQQIGIPFESYVTLFLVVLEFPAILVGICLAKGLNLKTITQKEVLREIFLGKSIFLLGMGMVAGAIFANTHGAFLNQFFISNFQGMLALFLFEMGVVAAAELKVFLAKSRFLFVFGILAPLGFAAIGGGLGILMDMSVGGITVLATLAASASYIAAPAAMQTSVPEANPSLSIGSSLGITFPFNIIVGIPLYYKIAEMIVTR